MKKAGYKPAFFIWPGRGTRFEPLVRLIGRKPISASEASPEGTRAMDGPRNPPGRARHKKAGFKPVFLCLTGLGDSIRTPRSTDRQEADLDADQREAPRRGEGHGWPESILPGAPDTKEAGLMPAFFVSGESGGLDENPRSTDRQEADQRERSESRRYAAHGGAAQSSRGRRPTLSPFPAIPYAVTP